MKKSIISLAIAAGLVASMPAQAGNDVKVKWFGFAQITAGMLDGNGIKSKNFDSDGNPEGGVAFGADRVRFGFKLKSGKIFGKLQADLNKAATGPVSGNLPAVIKDIEAGYKFSDAASLKVGQFKTPLGMDFNTSGKKLDITKRGMEKGLVLERAAGIMLSGRKIANGFGYDVFYGNPANRSKAGGGLGTVGVEDTYVVRAMYDMGKMMHVEGSYGSTANAATGTGASDYTVYDLAIGMQFGKAHRVKAEYIAGSAVGGVDGQDETVYLLHYGFTMNKNVELLVRYYGADASATGAEDTSLGNTYLGANFFLGGNRTNGRIQVNYVVASGDTWDSDTQSSTYGGKATKGYEDDALLAQYQVSF